MLNFTKKTQRDGEPLEKFVRGLYELAENCEFPQENDQVRDRFVIWRKSKELSEKFQLREDLSLEKAIEIARSYEQVKRQMGETQDNSVDAVTGERKETIKHSGWKKYPQKAANTSRWKKCIKNHNFDNCPAKGKIYRNCDKMNNFAIRCRLQTQNIREKRKQPTKRHFLGSICKNEIPEKKIDIWHVKLKVVVIHIILKNWYGSRYKCYQY